MKGLAPIVENFATYILEINKGDNIYIYVAKLFEIIRKIDGNRKIGDERDDKENKNNGWTNRQSVL